ncbi:MAG TPA: WYL domain-containing protein [Myxococcaceae bacterium]|nr:WYL domain-containing protein [Myxococcaceae bacterium]
MERTERLLDLVALLLDAREPISWAELRDAFPEDYQASSDEATERKFKRDKAELLELGIPIAYVQGDDDRKDGYVVDREAYYLPEVGLTPQEMAVLYAAGSAALASGAFPGRSDLAHALRKIGFFAGTEVPTPRVRMEWGAVPPALEQDLGPKLEELWNASATRKSVELSYYSPRSGQTTSRRVDPYGLAMRRGIWSLVGFCHLRKGIRTFHLHRIRALKVNPLKPKTPDFHVPNDFRLDEHVASYPWQHRIHPPVEVMLSLRGEISKLGPRLFPDARVHAEGSSSRVILSTTYTDGLLRYALSLSPDCSVLSPPAAVERWKQMAARILQTHETAQPAMGALA